MHQSITTLTPIRPRVKHLFRLGTAAQVSLHTPRACNCGRWQCRTRRDDEVQVKFSYAPRPEYYTADCAAEALRDDAARCVQWVWPTPATRRRLQAEQTAEAAMLLFQGRAA